MFVDEVEVYVKAGNGGDGLVGFRREKFVPKGGPAGGDGGRGGDILFRVDEGLTTLMDLRYNRHYKASRGENGMNQGKHGKNAEPLIVMVPPGTTITDNDTGRVLADLKAHGEEATIAQGGRGGRGNLRFASPRNPAPHIAENGEPGEERNVKVELKLIADVGLVGFPSVGKSTLLSVVSAAKPKVADYHFTTLAPNLGVVSTAEHESFVMADLPGLIEGAHEGIGLGHQFLRHVERTRIIVHVIDMARTEGRDPYEDFLAINNELKKYDSSLLERPQIIAANKMDMPEAEIYLKEFKQALSDEKIPIYPISSVTKNGIRDLLFGIKKKLDTLPKQDLLDEETVVYEYREEEPPFRIERDDDGTFVLVGEEIEKLFKMTDFNYQESAQRFSRQLRSMGVDDALRKRGAEDGDIVRLVDLEFEFIE